MKTNSLIALAALIGVIACLSCHLETGPAPRYVVYRAQTTQERVELFDTTSQVSLTCEGSYVLGSDAVASQFQVTIANQSAHEVQVVPSLAELASNHFSYTLTASSGEGPVKPHEQKVMVMKFMARMGPVQDRTSDRLPADERARLSIRVLTGRDTVIFRPIEFHVAQD